MSRLSVISQDNTQYFGILAYAVLHQFSDLTISDFIQLCNKQVDKADLIAKTLSQDLDFDDLTYLTYQFIDEELKTATKSTALRGNSIAAKLLRQQSQMYAYPFFEAQLGDVLDELLKLIEKNQAVFLDLKSDLDQKLQIKLSDLYTEYLSRLSNLVASGLLKFIIENSNELIRLYRKNKIEGSESTIIGGYLILRLAADFISEFLKNRNKTQFTTTLVVLIQKQLQNFFNAATTSKVSETTPWRIKWLRISEQICMGKKTELQELIDTIQVRDTHEIKIPEASPTFKLNILNRAKKDPFSLSVVAQT